MKRDFGIVCIALGATMGDSKWLWMPIGLIALGALLMWAAWKEGDRN